MVSSAFMQMANNNIKESLLTYVESEGIVYDESTTLKQLKYQQESGVSMTSMGMISVILKGEVSLHKKKITAGFGYNLPTGKEFIHFGTFNSDEITYDVKTDETRITAYDDMMKLTRLFKPIDIEYPVKIGQIFSELEGILGIKVSKNMKEIDLLLDFDMYSNTELTYRDFAEDVAELLNVSIFFENDELVTKKLGGNEITINQSQLKQYKLYSEYGPIDSIVLSRQPQNDNVIPKDVDPAYQNHQELRFDNNWIVDHKREEIIDSLFSLYEGITFIPFEISTCGLGYVELYDKLNIVVAGETIQTYVMGIELSFISGGILEILFMKELDKVTTEYEKASNSKKQANRTELKVDKVKNSIKAEINTINEQLLSVPNQYMSALEPISPKDGDNWIDISKQPYLHKIWDNETNDWNVVSDYNGSLDEVKSQINFINTSLELESGKIQTLVEQNTTIINGNEVTLKEAYSYMQQTVDSIQFAISESGGMNKIHNSVGINATNFWKVTGFVDTEMSVDIRNNTISGSAFRLKSGSLKQTFNTIVGHKYAMSCKVKKSTNTCFAAINHGLKTEFLFNLDTEHVDHWITFSFYFEATEYDATIEISSSGDELLISDIMVNDGEIPQQWSSNNDEIYTQNVRIDKEGISVYQENSDNKMVIDTVQMANYYNDKEVFTINGDWSSMQNLRVMNEMEIGEAHVYSPKGGLDIAIVKRKV